MRSPSRPISPSRVRRARSSTRSWQRLAVSTWSSTTPRATSCSLLEEVGLEEFDNHIAVNVRAPYLLVQAALPSLRASPAAVVVNVSSAAAAMYRRRQTLYGLTKAALEHLTMNLAAELAPDRIRVVCVRPGPVATEIHTGAVADPQARLAELGRLVPLGRIGEPEEIARWIWHLVDADAAWVTGAVLSIDGGRVLGPPEA